MDKQKQIEEIVKDMLDYAKTFSIVKNAIGEATFIREYEASIRGYANYLYNAGYRKIPENAVVLTREEYEKLKSLANNHCKYCHLMDLPDFETEKIVRDTTRKETAEKFAERLKDTITQPTEMEFFKNPNKRGKVDKTLLLGLIDEICKELTEG